MAITKIYVEAKKSKNFQTYTVGMEYDIEDPLDPDGLNHGKIPVDQLESYDEFHKEKIRELQAQCRKLCIEELEHDKNP
jgi:hypothetical protein